VKVLPKLPQNIDAEKSFLGSIFLDNTVIDREILTPEDFYLSIHKQIYQTILDLWNERSGIDPVTLSERLSKEGISLDGGRKEYIDDLSDIVPTAANASHYARILREKTSLRRAKNLNLKLDQAIGNADIEAVERIRDEISTLCNLNVVTDHYTLHRLDAAQCAMTEPPIQEYVVGHLPVPDEIGIYGLLIGPDGTRKSWLALHMALAVAAGRPVAQGPDGTFLWPAPKPGRVAYITLEDSKNVLWRRIWNIAHMPGHEWVGTQGTSQNLAPLILPEFTMMTLDHNKNPVEGPDVQRIIKYAVGARLIIIDPLTEVIDADESGSREGRMTANILRKISRETGAAVLAVHHQSKAGMLTREKNHQSSRGSSKIPAGSRWSVVLQGIDPNEAEKQDIKEFRDWTEIIEGKASYAALMNGEKWLKTLRICDGTGREVASAPVAFSTRPSDKTAPERKKTNPNLKLKLVVDQNNCNLQRENHYEQD